MSLDKFRYWYEINPISLKGGIAENLPGKKLSIISLTEGKFFPQGVTSPLSGIGAGAAQSSQQAAQQSTMSYDEYFAHFRVMGGGTLIDNNIGMYPFANQTVAANAVITNPLRVSLSMTCPAKGPGGMFSRQAVITQLQNSLAQHINLGGLFIVATPSFLYDDMIMTSLRDITDTPSQQDQIVYQLDFVKPLVTEEAAQAAQNSLMNKIEGQQKVEGDPPKWSSPSTAVGQSGVGVPAQIIPSANPIGSSVGGQ